MTREIARRLFSIADETSEQEEKETWAIDADGCDKLMTSSSVLGAIAYGGPDGTLQLRRKTNAYADLQHTIIRPSPSSSDDADRNVVEIVSILDPLTETAQRVSGVLMWLRNAFGSVRDLLCVLVVSYQMCDDVSLSPL